MTVEQRVARYLNEHRQPYCDGCLARVLRLGAGANRTMARNATAALAATNDFRRGPGRCARCENERLVTLAVGR
jgi:hypothetical protein